MASRGNLLKLEVLIDRSISEGFARVRQEIAAAEKLNAAPVWMGPLARFDADQAKETWASQGVKGGGAWPDLSQGEGNMAGYIKWKNRNWPQRKINVWRGDTRDSFRHVSGGDHIARVRAGAFEFGSRAKLAKQMHEGTSGPWRTVYLREKEPRRRRNRRTGEMTPGRNWFAFRFKTIPARPLVRKSENQQREIKRAAIKYMLKHVGQTTPGLIGREIGKMSDRLRANPRA